MGEGLAQLQEVTPAVPRRASFIATADAVLSDPMRQLMGQTKPDFFFFWPEKVTVALFTVTFAYIVEQLLAAIY